MKHSKWTINPLVGIFTDEAGNITTVSADAEQIERYRWSKVDGAKPYVTDFEKKCAALKIPPQQIAVALENLKYSHG